MPSFRERKAAERLQEAVAAAARDEEGTAERAAAAAVRLDPGLRAAWDLWAEILERRGKLIEAARVLGDALEHHPDDPTLQLARCHAQIETGQFAGAERLLGRLQKRWPDSREPLAYAARVVRDLREFTRLEALLEQALAGAWADDVEFVALSRACATWRGQGLARDEPARMTSMRERLLSEAGVVLLGTGHDDGLSIPWYSTYLCSNYDVVATCARLLGFVAQFGWRWEQVAAIDPAARVLAILLAEALDAELVELPTSPTAALPDAALPDPNRCLAVASLLEPGWADPERHDYGEWALRCADAGGLFAFGALDYRAHDRLPPLLGVAGGERICLPWWRLGEARIGFARFGLIEELAPEIDGRPPEQIARDYRSPLANFELGPNFDVQLSDLLEHRAELQPGLRSRGDFARILPKRSPRTGPKAPLADALERGDVAEFLRALGLLEADVARIGERELGQLERWFEATPEVRSRLSDLLYRVAPDRFSTLLHRLVARPEAEIPIHERDGLLHLYGCNPWTGPGGDPSRATTQLRRWLEIGVATNRSEIVQSKYGLHHLAEAEDFGELLATLFADEPAIILGTLRWLHDNPAHHDHALAVPELLELLDHDHPDVRFEALQCLRAARIAVPLTTLEPILAGQRSAHPRMISAAVEQLELAPIAEAHPRLLEFLVDDEPALVWAAARSLIRGGVDEAERVCGAERVANRIVAVEQGGGDPRQLLRALASADSFVSFEPLLRASDSPSLMKVVAAALTPAMLELDDPRLLPYLRRFSDAFGLDPAFGYASYLGRHGDVEHDLNAVYGAQGATDVRAGYEAKAVLARWGDAEARAELERALDYAPPFRMAAFEVWFRVLRSQDWARLDAALACDDPSVHAVVWAILSQADGDDPWTEALALQLRADWQREAAWASFMELRLRGQIPSKFEVGAQSASFAVLEALLPSHFEDLCTRARVGSPDRVSVDLLEWLAVRRPDQARAWANQLRDSPHWGMRQCARRIVSRA